MTYINKKFIADPLKKETNAHCTHLQITQAEPQTKICKRVQFPQPTVKNEKSIMNFNKYTL